MSKDNPDLTPREALSRRHFLAGSATLATIASLASETTLAAENEERIQIAMAHKAGKQKKYRYNAPFEDFRTYILALEERGLLIRFKEVDQDNYEATAIIYRITDEFGWTEAPCVMYENLKIDGEWIKGPMIANHHGHWDTECIVFGEEPVPNRGVETLRKAMAYLESRLEDNGTAYVEIEPNVVAAETAPCKEVILTGDDIDITKFAFITSNPADGGRYINTGSIFTSDPENGYNFGTYRCQMRGPRLIGVNPEPNQTGWKHLMAAKERGEEFAKVSIALGQDPYVWVVSGSRVADRLRGNPQDELAIAGGLKGAPIDIVKSETNDHMVPANCEMIIEGEVPLQEPGMPEGPFGEMYGYLGARKDENFVMRITCVTHRKDPWLLNSFTGATRGYVTSPVAVLYNKTFSKLIPGFIELYSPVDTTGLTYVRIKKTAAGQGLKIGKRLCAIVPIFKVVVVVDEDVDIYSSYEVGLAMGARYQPAGATYIFEDGRGMPLDPSTVERGVSDKIVMDCTKQWPEEGGPEDYAELNRDLLERLAPNAMPSVDEKWGDQLTRYYTRWKRGKQI